MKKITLIFLAAMVVAMAFSSPSEAGHGGHGGYHGHGGHVGVGIYVGPGWYSWPWAPYYSYYPYYPYAASPPVVIREPAQEYVQPLPGRDDPDYWYYCPDSKGYYPYVKKCPKGWLKVVPPAGPPDEEE
jgi:hypothetical protein